MKFSAVLRVAAVALATGALLVPGIGPAKAATYPPRVSVLYASPFVSHGYSSVSVAGEHLASGLTVRASRGSRSTVAKLHVHSSGTTGTALVKMGSVLPTTAGRYAVDFALHGASVTGAVTTTQTYTVGKAISIKSFRVVRKSYGLYISGKAAKSAPVKISTKYGSKWDSKTVKASSGGSFYYRLYKTSKGTYTAKARVAPNKKYFSTSVTLSCRR